MATNRSMDLVPLPVHTMSSPVASGSSVPACPTYVGPGKGYKAPENQGYFNSQAEIWIWRGPGHCQHICGKNAPLDVSSIQMCAQPSRIASRETHTQMPLAATHLLLAQEAQCFPHK